MIGEIRDLETAQIAVQASLTGHLVLATLHTNDAVSAVTRLVDMGVEPFVCLAYSPSAWCGACARIAGSKRTAAGARSAARLATRPATAGAPASTNCS